MTGRLQVAEAGEAGSVLACALQAAPGLTLPVLVNIGVWPDLAALMQRCDQFAASAGGDALIITALAQSDESGTVEWQVAAAGLWAFTRHAALAWAPRGVRLNVVGCGVGPPPGQDPVARGRSAAPIRAESASVEDVVRTIRFVAGAASMTGQFIRLGDFRPVDA